MKYDILNLFQGVSVILVFVTLIFSTKYSDIINEIDKDKPNGDKAIKRMKNQIWIKILTIIFPQLIILIMISAIVLPVFKEINTYYKFSLSSLDPIVSLFVLMSFLILYLLFWSLGLGLRLIIKAYKK